VGVTDPNSEIIDAGIQCFVEENQVPTHLEDKLGLAITEHFTCSERTLQKKRSNLEGNDKFLCCSVGSPHSHSLDLTQADGAMPVFEGFIMQTDDKQPCVAGEGISFDKFDLSDTAIERASILEQLCRICLHADPIILFFNHVSFTHNTKPVSVCSKGASRGHEPEKQSFYE
jgi:hypothetical protein